MGYRVVESGSIDEYFQQPLPEGPACLILNMRTPGVNRPKLPQALMKHQKALPVIFIADGLEISPAIRAMASMTVDILSKPLKERDLLSAVACALDRSRLEGNAMEAAALDEIRVRISTLTPSEARVLAQVVNGKLNKQIASEFGVTEQTIKMHRSSLMNKMQAQSVADLVRMVQSVERTAQLGGNLSRCILDAMPFPVFAVDFDVRIVDFNLTASKMLDQDRLMVISRRAGEILHCVHSTEGPGGCGRSSHCSDCMIRNSVNAALSGMKPVRSVAKMDLVTDGKLTEASFLVTAAPFAYEGRDIALLILENMMGWIPDGGISVPQAAEPPKPDHDFSPRSNPQPAGSLLAEMRR